MRLWEDDSARRAALLARPRREREGLWLGQLARTDSLAGLSGQVNSPQALPALRPEAVEGVHAGGEPSDADAAASDVEGGTGGSPPMRGRAFLKDDFGRPGTMMDALGAQTSLEVVGGLTLRAAAMPMPGTADAPAPREPEKKSFLDEEAEFGKGAMAVSMVLGLVLGVVLFIVAPAFVTNLIVGEYDQNTVLWNVVDGLLRVAVFVFYLWLIGRMAEIKRMFGYHGAEHKTIHCYEHGLPLTPENARSFPRLHVRCGTAFLIMVMIIAILVYTVTPINGLIAAWGVPDGAPKLALVILVRILLMPVIAGISHEITVRWAGSHPENPLVKVVLWPGMQMQYSPLTSPTTARSNAPSRPCSAC